MSAVARHAKPSADFPAKLAQTQASLVEAIATHADITQANSLGVEDMVLADILHRLALKPASFVLQTGRLHAQTLQLLERMQTHYGSAPQLFAPDTAQAAAWDAANGEFGMRESVAQRKACCHIRKMLPLAKALAGRSAWITGLRREQSDGRSEVNGVETESSGRIKYNPLAHWRLGDVWHYVQLHNVPYNPLHDAFFPSIGCEPCTRAVALGEDFRAGRWWWEHSGNQECGLHVQTLSPQIPLSSQERA